MVGWGEGDAVRARVADAITVYEMGKAGLENAFVGVEMNQFMNQFISWCASCSPEP